MKNNRAWPTLVVVLCGTLLSSMGINAAEPELKYVVVLSRHGVRSPTWDMARLNQYSAEPWPDFGVPPGELTPHGRELIKILGAYYRERFTGEHLLHSNGCANANRIYIWADTDQRTLETGRAFAESIAPGCGVAVHSVSPGTKDPLFLGVPITDPQAAADAVRKRLGRDPQHLLIDHRAEFETLQLILGTGNTTKKLLESPAQVAAITSVDGVDLRGPFATASTLSEDLVLEYADGMRGNRLGWGRLDEPKLIQILELHRVYADLMRRTPYLARARASNLLRRIRASMEQAVSGKPVPGALGTPSTALLILSGHDTNQSNISGLLDLSWALSGLPKEETPPGGALIFSVWLERKEPHARNYFVRLEYLAASLDQMHNLRNLTVATPPSRQPISIPGCEAPEHSSACPWERFDSLLQSPVN